MRPINADFDLGSVWSIIDAALREVETDTGFALVRGLPRSDLTAEELAYGAQKYKNELCKICSAE